MPVSKVAVIGLDCASPRFFFGPEAFDLPHIQRLLERSTYGLLESCHPPITVPAWAVMTTGRDPGALGCYGFRNRSDHSYTPMRVSTATSIQAPRVWDLLGAASHESILLGIPQTWPPSEVSGHLVTGLLTPDTSSPYTYPVELATELERECGGYKIDVPNFRGAEPAELIAGLNRLLENRFRIAEYLLESKPWDFFMMVDIGLDRLHHAFWRYADPAHPKHVPNHPYGAAFRRYYEKIDAGIGRILDRIPSDTAFLLVSDHGAKPIHGAIRINQWLIDHGYLVLRNAPDGPGALDWKDIDWSRTRAWSSGGYYARVFMNVKGREPEGIVEDPACLADKLIDRIAAIPAPSGAAMQTRVLRPAELFATANGTPPDLFVYFDDLRYRAAGTVGVEGIYADENDTGPDDANHAFEGLYACAVPGRREAVQRDASILDIAPTILDLMNVSVPGDMPGHSLV